MVKVLRPFLDGLGGAGRDAGPAIPATPGQGFIHLQRHVGEHGYQSLAGAELRS